MASSLDISLDDRIKSRSNRGRGRGRGKALSGRGSGTLGGGRRTGAVNGRRTGNGGRTGAVRRGPLMVNNRASSYAIAKSIRRPKALAWQSDLFEDSLRAAGIQGVEADTKLYVSNLDRGVTNEDIRELFSELGELKRYAVHYDKNGHPTGSAEVVYNRRSDAFAALKRYNNVLLDGKPMKIEIVGTNFELPVTARVNVSAMNGQRKRTVVMTPRGGRGGGPAMLNRGAGWGHRGGSRGGSVSMRGRGRGRGRPGRGGGRGRGRKDGVEKSAEQLDKELETYHAEAMQT